MEARKVLVREGDDAIITCPLCRKTKKLSVALYREKKKRDLRIKCSCAEIFRVCLEYRKHPRKPVKLLAQSINLSKHRERQDVIIRNISLGGIGFSPFQKHRNRINDLLQVLFSLDDCHNTFINAKVSVRAANRDYVGCEFNDIRYFAGPLGFYLLEQ